MPTVIPLMIFTAHSLAFPADTGEWGPRATCRWGTDWVRTPPAVTQWNFEDQTAFLAAV